MKVRVFSSLLCVAALSLVVAIQAQDAPKTKPVDKETTQVRDDSTLEEQKLQRHFREFQEQVLKLKLRLERSPRAEDRERAVTLQKVLDKAQDMSISIQFEKVISDLKKDNFSTTTDIQIAAVQAKKLADDLRELVALIRDDGRAKRNADEEKALKELIKDIERAILQQKQVQGQTDIGKTDKKELNANQKQVTEAIAKIAEKMQGKNAQGGEGKNQKGENKDGGKNGEGKKGESKDQGKEGKKGETKDQGEKKGGDPKSGEAKPGEGKGGEPKDPKGGDPKSGDPKGGKEGKEGESKPGAKGSESKEAGSKGSKGSESKPGEAKESKGGKEGDPKEGAAKDQGEKKGGVKEKTAEAKGAEGEKKNNDKKDPTEGKQGEAKAGPKGPEQSGAKEAKAGSESKPGEAKKGSESKQGESKPGSKSQGQGEAKDGGQQPPPQGQQPNAKNDPNQKPPAPDDGKTGKKQVQEAEGSSQKAEEKIAKDNPKDAGPDQGKVITELEKAKKKLEDLLRQLREEEKERVLADLLKRCEKMLAMQLDVLGGTEQLFGAIQKNEDKKPAQPNRVESAKLSDKEKDIVGEASRAIEVLEAEGTAVAFPEVFQQVREDMKHVQRRLDITDAGVVTQAIERDIVESLKEMIEALKKAQKDQQAKKSDPKEGQPKSGQPQDQKLLEQIAELKMIRSMQIRVNNRTETYGKMYPGEQAAEPNIRREVIGIAERQERIFEITNKIAKGDNK